MQSKRLTPFLAIVFAFALSACETPVTGDETAPIEDRSGTGTPGTDPTGSVAAGAASAAGAAGAPGTAGMPGTPGAPGAAGTAGTAGAPGTAGASGTTGAAGTPGSAGAPGAGGVAGAPGAAGAAGTMAGGAAPGSDAASAAQAAAERAALSPEALNDPKSPLARRSIYFDFDSFVIREEFRPVLEVHARFLNANRDRKLVVQGNTDDRGSREYNLALGQKRAEAVRRAMTALGVAEGQIEAVSFGEEKPKAMGSDEASWAENRRADLAY